MNFTIRNTTAGDTEVLLYGDIGWDNDAADFARQIQAIDAGHIILRVHSPGGGVFDGLAIMNALRSHPATVTAVVEGLAASAASFITVGAADTVIMRPSSRMMIHDALGLCIGNAADMEHMKGLLDAESDNLARIYARRAGGDVTAWRDAMRDETWFTDEEAVAAGLADRVEDGKKAATPENKFSLMNQFRGRRGDPPAALFNHAPTGQKEEAMPFKNDIARLVGIDEAADETLVLAALKEALEEQAHEPPEDPVIDAHVPTETKNETPTPEVPAEGESPASKAPAEESLTMLVDREAYAEMKADAAYGREARLKAEAAARVAKIDAAIKANRISSAGRDKWIEAIHQDEEGVTRQLEAIPDDTIPRAEIGHGIDPHAEDTTRPDPDIGDAFGGVDDNTRF